MSSGRTDSFDAQSALSLPDQTVTYYRLATLAGKVPLGLERLPYTLKIFLESALRNASTPPFSEEDVLALADWQPGPRIVREFPFFAARMVLQDFSGLPAIVDFAAMRSAMLRVGGDPKRINPLVPGDLVIDHSVQVDQFGSAFAFGRNVEREYQRNRERYELFRWGQQAFENFRVVPPGTGIIHQVNLEYLSQVVYTRRSGSETVAFPDTVFGTDSHTTMVNSLGVLGWGVGGIEAEAALLGQPLYMLTPEIIGFRLLGEPPEGVTATDLVLTIAQLLRRVGVVGKFIEFFGEGICHLSLPDRATISNMSPEYGATATMFPIDDETLRYLRLSGRSAAQVDLVERYAKEQGLFWSSGNPDPAFDRIVDLDLSTVEPSLAGPRRPQERVPLPQVGESFRAAYPVLFTPSTTPEAGPMSETSAESVGQRAAVATLAPEREVIEIRLGHQFVDMAHGSVAIAAITSCTNTSNPAVMIAAGILAKKAVERGLTVSPAVKTSLAPGSRVVTGYLEKAGLIPYLEALRFHLVGYGCTTCIGNSGPLAAPVAEAIRENDLVVAAVLSGNRNFEGRIHPQVRASYLASPPLVVAFALAGTVDIDLTSEPLGEDPNGNPVFLREVWPTTQEIQEAVDQVVTPDLFEARYRDVFSGDSTWQSLPVPEGDLYRWDPASTYVQEPPFFQDLQLDPPSVTGITGARILAMVGDSVTTDHISPAGSIAAASPAGQYLIDLGVQPGEFNSYGTRRGNHEVMVRGTFANIRLRNQLAGGKEGGWTAHFPSGELTTIYDAATRYQADEVPLLVIAGAEYGTGSSRDWAAKGTTLLGVRAVIAVSYERIHRSNLVGMGVLPLQFQPGENAETLELTGRETYTIEGISDGLTPGKVLTVRARDEEGVEKHFQVIARLDSTMEIEYYRHGGILPMILRDMVKG